MSTSADGAAALDFRPSHLIATVIDACGQQPSRGPGHPPTETIRVVATLGRFLREGTPWRGLTASEDQASGSTLCRRLACWAEAGVLAKVHALLVRMLRGHPDLIIDSCSVRAKRGGDLTGPNPTDRAKRGSKYHVAVDGDGVPVACTATAANVNDTVAFERLFLSAFAVMAASVQCSPTGATTLSSTAPSAAGSAPSRTSTSAASPADQGLGSGAGPSSAATHGCWRISASLCATTGSASSSSHYSKQLAYSWLQAGSPGSSENRLLVWNALA
jgi:Transposase DDE domain